MMPNRYMPTALADMIDEEHQDLIRQDQGKGATSEQSYPPEYEALVGMLQPEYQEEYRERRGEA